MLGVTCCSGEGQALQLLPGIFLWVQLLMHEVLGRRAALDFLMCVFLLPQLGEVSCEKMPCQQACADSSLPPRDCCSSCPGNRASVSWTFPWNTGFSPLCSSSQKHRTWAGLGVRSPGSERERGLLKVTQ